MERFTFVPDSLHYPTTVTCHNPHPNSSRTLACSLGCWLTLLLWSLQKWFIAVIKCCTFDLLCIKNIAVVVVSAQTGFIRLNYCTIAFVVSKMKPLKLTWQGIHAQGNSWLGTNNSTMFYCATNAWQSKRTKHVHTFLGQSFELLFCSNAIILDW